MKPTSHNAHRRGTVMAEMVLVLPLLIAILALLLFLGPAMVRLQHGKTMARYEVWRMAVRAPGPSANDALGHPQLNQLFFANRASQITLDAGPGYPNEPDNTFNQFAGSVSDNTGRFAQAVTDQLEHGRSRLFHVTHPSRNDAWGGPIASRFTRIGHDWRFVNGWTYNTSRAAWEMAPPFADHLDIIRDVFYENEDAPILDLDQSGNRLASVLRRIYMAHPGYAGPTIDPVFSR
ncbi:MAG: hypothetical protein GC164_10740 [Phycisphaera sp.]|nr:hypothetical protein [Phycisphaera sp.]